MKKKIIRTISVILVGTLVLTALTFCTDTKDETTKAAEQQAETVQAVKSEAATMSAAEMLEKATQSSNERSADSSFQESEDEQTETIKEVRETEATTEETTEEQTEAETQEENYEETTTKDWSAEFGDGMTTALGLTVPSNTRGTYISLYEVAELGGPSVWQDGSWYWVDASDTTPQRGDIVVYSHQSCYPSSTHAAICVDGYAYNESDGQMKYKCVDGNYGAEPGTVEMGYWDNSPNKGWTDSFSEAPGVEIAKGVWRSEAYGELLAEGAEAAYYECCNIGQMAFLEKYIPEGVYGGWCYYLICIAVNKVARGEY